MKLRYFGTAAAEGWPALFCECPACRRARAAGGRNIRTRSQSLLDDELLIDFPADTYHHCLTFELDISRIENLLITHTHEDHLYAEDLQNRRVGFASYEGEPPRPLTVWGSAGVGPFVERQQALADLKKDGRVLYFALEPFKTYTIGRHTVTPLPANHDPKACPFIYILSDGKKNLLYAHDTGLLLPEVWQYLAAHPVRFDFLSLDCTGGALPGWRDGHMCFETNLELTQRLTAEGFADDSTAVCLNHFSHNGLWTYDEIAPKAAERGWLVAYDGLTVEF